MSEAAIAYKLKAARVSSHAVHLTELNAAIRLRDGRIEGCSRPASRSDNGLLRAARSFRCVVLETLPPERRDSLEVELGSVRVARSERQRRFSLERPYALAVSGNAVLMLQRGKPRRLAPHWTGPAGVDDLEGDLPVVLGPSAVLELAARIEGLPIPEGRIDVGRRDDCPYPPHDARLTMFAFDGTAARNGGSGAVGSDPVAATLIQLVVDATGKSRPPGAVDDFGLRSITVTCRRSAPAPVAALVLDSLEAAPAATGQVVRWSAEWSVADSSGLRAGGTPLSFDARADDVVSQIRAAVRPAAPAHRRDPIGGEVYGTAPHVICELTSRALLAGGTQ